MIPHRRAPAVALAIVISTLALLTFMLLGPSRDGPNGEPAVPNRLSAAAFAELTSMGHWLGPRDAPVVAVGYFERMHGALMDDPDIQRYSRVVTLLGESAEIDDLDSLRFCVRSRRSKAALSEQWRHAEGLGVSATPTLFINGVPLVGAAPEAVLDSLIASGLRR